MSSSKSTSNPIPPQEADHALCALVDEFAALVETLGAAVQAWAEALAVHPERMMEIAQACTTAEREHRTTPLRLERVVGGE